MLLLFVNIILSVLSMCSYLMFCDFTLMSIVYALIIFISAFVSFTIAVLLIFAIITLCIPKNKKIEGDSPIYRRILCRVVEYAFIFLRVKYKVIGDELVPENKRFLLVANHLNESDPLFLLLAMGVKRPIGVLAKKDLWDWFFVPNAIVGVGSLPIDRENDREAAKSIIAASKLIKDDKMSIAVFPEGYTEKGRGLLPFRDGVFKIAQRANAPIVVAVINGTDGFFKRLFFKKNYIEVKIIDCISAETVAELKTHEIGELIHKQMEDEIK